MFEQERKQLIAMVAIAVANNWEDSTSEDSPEVTAACVEFAESYVFPVHNGKIQTDMVHNDVDTWAKKYINNFKK